MVEKTGAMGTPAMLIGEEVVIGWNPDKVSQLLGLE